MPDNQARHATHPDRRSTRDASQDASRGASGGGYRGEATSVEGTASAHDRLDSAPTGTGTGTANGDRVPGAGTTSSAGASSARARSAGETGTGSDAQLPGLQGALARLTLDPGARRGPINRGGHVVVTDPSEPPTGESTGLTTGLVTGLVDSGSVAGLHASAAGIPRPASRSAFTAPLAEGDDAPIGGLRAAPAPRRGSAPSAAAPSAPPSSPPVPASAGAQGAVAVSGAGGITGRDGERTGGWVEGRADQGLDWGLVRALRQQASRRLMQELERRPGLDQASQEAVGRGVIAEVLRDHADSAIGAGDFFSTQQERQVAKALFDQLYRAGRLQPLLDIPGLENLRIQGFDDVKIQVNGSDWQPVAPVADSNEELIEALQFLATRSGQSERAFTASNPHLHMTLPGGARLAAAYWITPLPTVTIRIHRHTDVDLYDLVELGMLDEGCAQFLTACVRARKSIMISGAQSAGKTTLLRALANELGAWESLATIETEYELGLHHYPERHQLVLALEARPGSGERLGDGSRAGEITLRDHLESALRHTVDWIIVGECRGPEVGSMLQAMQGAAGSMSTVHAVHAEGAVQRLVTQMTSYLPNANPNFALLQIATSIDVVVQLRTIRTATGGRYRYISEIIQLNGLADGGSGRADITRVFEPGPDRRAVPAHLPTWLGDLEDEGFDAGWLAKGQSTWPDLDLMLGTMPWGDDLGSEPIREPSDGPRSGPSGEPVSAPRPGPGSSTAEPSTLPPDAGPGRRPEGQPRRRTRSRS